MMAKSDHAVLGLIAIWTIGWLAVYVGTFL